MPRDNRRSSQSKQDYDRWVAEAQQIEETDNPLNVPYDVALEEAVDVAAFFQRYWEPADGRPGLRRVRQRLPESTGQEILSLVAAVQEAQTRLLLVTDPVVIDHGERARFVVDELESAIEFTLDDGIEEPADAQLARLKEFHAEDGQRSSALAQSLRDYAALAESLKERLVASDEEFDPKLIREARELTERLMKPMTEGPAGDEASAAALATRNRMLRLLLERVRSVRRCAAHVFRRHPEIVREATSAYERRRRAAARRAKLREEQAQPSQG